MLITPTMLIYLLAMLQTPVYMQLLSETLLSSAGLPTHSSASAEITLSLNLYHSAVCVIVSLWLQVHVFHWAMSPMKIEIMSYFSGS